MANRNTLVYKKIKIILKQRDQIIPSGPSDYDHQDIPGVMDDTITEFLRDTTERRETFTEGSIRLDQQNSDGKVNITEKYI